MRKIRRPEKREGVELHVAELSKHLLRFCKHLPGCGEGKVRMKVIAVNTDQSPCG